MSTYHIQNNDTLPCIADRYGYKEIAPIWDHANNAELKRNRPNPNILFPGDSLFIPEKANKEESRGTAQQHTFSIQNPTQTLRLCVEDGEGKPLANIPYLLHVGKMVLRGTTDGSGNLEQQISLRATEGDLAIGGYIWPLSIGGLHPIEKTPDCGKSGIGARLQNLGYAATLTDSLTTPRMQNALRAFQQENHLPEDGVCAPGSATQSQLTARHGC